jgi:hypothetical protein
MSQLGLFPGASREAQRAAPAPLFTHEPSGRFQRCCPYCHRALSWRHIRRVDAELEEMGFERPFCWKHGPLKAWRCIDQKYREVYAVGHLYDRIGTHYLKTPWPVRFSSPGAQRWKTGQTRALQRAIERAA